MTTLCCGQVCVECLLCFVRCNVSDGAVQARFVIPVDPLESFPFDLADRFPWTEKLDDLGLELVLSRFGAAPLIT